MAFYILQLQLHSSSSSASSSTSSIGGPKQGPPCPQSSSSSASNPWSTLVDSDTEAFLQDILTVGLNSKQTRYDRFEIHDFGFGFQIGSYFNSFTQKLGPDSIGKKS